MDVGKGGHAQAMHLKLKSNTGEEFNLEHPELSLIIRKFLIT
jgi:hypothetical protein